MKISMAKFTHGQWSQQGHEQGKGHNRDTRNRDTSGQGHRQTGTGKQTDRDRDTDGEAEG